MPKKDKQKKYDPSLHRFRIDRDRYICFGDFIFVHRGDKTYAGVFCGITAVDDGTVELHLELAANSNVQFVPYDYAAGDRIGIAAKHPCARTSHTSVGGLRPHDTVCMAYAPLDDPLYGELGVIESIECDDSGKQWLTVAVGESEAKRVPVHWCTKQPRCTDAQGIVCEMGEILWPKDAISASEFCIVRKLLKGNGLSVIRPNVAKPDSYFFMNANQFVHTNPEVRKESILAVPKILCKSDDIDTVESAANEIEMRFEMAIFHELRRRDVEDTDSKAR